MGADPIPEHASGDVGGAFERKLRAEDPGLLARLGDLLGIGFTFPSPEHYDMALEWAARAYRAGQAAVPDGPRTWQLPDGAEARARIVVVVDWKRQRVDGMTADNAEAQRWCRELIDRHGGDNLAGSQYVGLVKVGPGSLFVDALSPAPPADGQDGDGHG